MLNCKGGWEMLPSWVPRLLIIMAAVQVETALFLLSLSPTSP